MIFTMGERKTVFEKKGDVTKWGGAARFELVARSSKWVEVMVKF
jgi:hypothetical protein